MMGMINKQMLKVTNGHNCSALNDKVHTAYE